MEGESHARLLLLYACFVCHFRNVYTHISATGMGMYTRSILFTRPVWHRSAGRLIGQIKRTNITFFLGEKCINEQEVLLLKIVFTLHCLLLINSKQTKKNKKYVPSEQIGIVERILIYFWCLAKILPVVRFYHRDLQDRNRLGIPLDPVTKRIRKCG